MSSPTAAERCLLSVPREILYIVYGYIIEPYDIEVRRFGVHPNYPPAVFNFVRLRSSPLPLTCRAISLDLSDEMQKSFSGALHLPNQHIDSIDWEFVFHHNPSWQWIMPRVTNFPLIAF